MTAHPVPIAVMVEDPFSSHFARMSDAPDEIAYLTIFQGLMQAYLHLTWRDVIKNITASLYVYHRRGLRYEVTLAVGGFDITVNSEQEGYRIHEEIEAFTPEAIENNFLIFLRQVLKTQLRRCQAALGPAESLLETVERDLTRKTSASA